MIEECTCFLILLVIFSFILFRKKGLGNRWEVIRYGRVVMGHYYYFGGFEIEWVKQIVVEIILNLIIIIVINVIWFIMDCCGWNVFWSGLNLG